MSSPTLDVRVTKFFDYRKNQYVYIKHLMRDGEVVGLLKNDGSIELESSQYSIEEVSENAGD